MTVWRGRVFDAIEVSHLRQIEKDAMKTIDRVGSMFLRRILRRMKELGVSQTELARRMNVSRPYVTKVLSRDVNFSFKTAAKLANALKMDFFPDLRERKASDAAADFLQAP